MYQCQIVRTRAEVVGSQPRAHLLQCSKLWGLAFIGGTALPGLPWWPSGQDPTLRMQGAQAGSLVRELDPTCQNQDFTAATKDQVRPGVAK